MKLRILLFAAASVALVGISIGLVALRANSARSVAPPPSASPSALDAIVGRPHIAFVHTSDYAHRNLAVAALDDLTAPYVTNLTCQRVYAASTGGVCLGSDGTVAYAYNARTFSRMLEPQERIEVQGIPSRVRVSPSGRYGSATVFVSGDSYGAPFSTRAFLFDLTRGEAIGHLEEFTVLKDGRRFESPSFNFWGVTFAADERHFYATLGEGGVGGTTHLVSGDLETREMRVLRSNVECPSLSPDGRRIAFKKRVNDHPGEWRLAVLDLTTLEDHLIDAETRSVDDQVEWLDDAHVLYEVLEAVSGGLRVDIWSTSVDDDAAPQVFLRDAASPSVVRL
jgi:WD40-like Beta Propeller Repeat